MTDVWESYRQTPYRRSFPSRLIVKLSELSHQSHSDISASLPSNYHGCLCRREKIFDDKYENITPFSLYLYTKPKQRKPAGGTTIRKYQVSKCCAPAVVSPRVSLMMIQALYDHLWSHYTTVLYVRAVVLWLTASHLNHVGLCNGCICRMTKRSLVVVNDVSIYDNSSDSSCNLLHMFD